MKNLILLLSLCFLFVCKKQQPEGCSDQHNSLAKNADFLCGVVVDLPKVNWSPRYGELVKNQFNSVTAENIMKPSFLHPIEGVFNWIEADQLASFCKSNNKRLHGHTLIWHQQLPDWMNNYQGTQKDWEDLFENHIKQIVTHFKGKVASWDVVNEAFNEDGTLRNTIWKQHIGSSYIEKAFNYAHQADPNAKLFYNDYSLVINPVKRAAILAHLNRLKAKGVPIHGIGLQMHIFTAFPENKNISKAFDDVWKNDYLVHVSEMEVSMNPLSKKMPTAPKRELKRQADKYAFVFKAYNLIPDRYKFGITIWGVGDGDSWIRYFYNRDDFPLLFDDNYEPKPAYCNLISTL